MITAVVLKPFVLVSHCHFLMSVIENVFFKFSVEFMYLLLRDGWKRHNLHPLLLMFDVDVTGGNDQSGY